MLEHGRAAELPTPWCGTEDIVNSSFWTRHYVTATDPAQVRRAVTISQVSSGPDSFDLVHFRVGSQAPNILVSPGSGGHAYVFAEFAYHLHSAGYNVFVMPKHGGRTIDKLLTRHRRAVDFIAGEFNNTIGVYGEGLGGYVVFYLALAQAPIGGIVCQNSPAIMTEPAYRDALLRDTGPWSKSVRRRRLMMPLLPGLARFAPNLRVPVSSYLSWKDLIDTRADTREVERRLVLDGYLKDPDFDRWYPLSAVMSLLTTPPPGPLSRLTTPTMFVVASEGPTPGYIVDLHRRLPAIPTKLVRVEGSVYWMLSHPCQAATLVADWFASTLPQPASAPPTEAADAADHEHRQ